MSEQEVNHAENIVQIISRKDDEIRQLKSNLIEAVGDRDDRGLELAEAVRTVTSHKLSARKKDRKHEQDQLVLKERIEEITGQCNELYASNKQLTADLESVNKKQKPHKVDNNFVLHLIMCEGVKQLGNMIHAAVHAFINPQTNKSTEALHLALVIDYVSKQPSLYRTAARYVNSLSGTMPDQKQLEELIDQFVLSNADLFIKDPDVRALREGHLILTKAYGANNKQSAALRDNANLASWLPLLGSHMDESTHESDETYLEAFSDSVRVICRHLISENF